MSLHQFSASSSQETKLLRIIHFEKAYNQIVTVLDDYVKKSNNQAKDGWQDEAISFYRRLSGQLRAKCSLVDLKSELLAFCDKLRSPFNAVLNAIVGEEWTKKIGDKVNAPGSTLREDLLIIAQTILPFSAYYILEEIHLSKQKPIRTSTDSAYLSFNIREYDHEHLSEEGLRVLNIICGDDDLTRLFWQGAKDNELDINARSLLDNFKKSRRKKLGYF